MIQKVIRNVASDTLTESGYVHVEPYKLVKITFSTGDYFFSEGKTSLFGIDTYDEASIQVGKFTWGKDGNQTGSIVLFNSENNDAVAIVLTSRVAGSLIKIYQTYKTGSGVSDHTTPVLLVSGECSESAINPDAGNIKISVLTENASTQYVPNRYFTPSEGFNHIPAVGRRITFGNEIFLFRRAK